MSDLQKAAKLWFDLTSSIPTWKFKYYLNLKYNTFHILSKSINYLNFFYKYIHRHCQTNHSQCICGEWKFVIFNILHLPLVPMTSLSSISYNSSLVFVTFVLSLLILRLLVWSILSISCNFSAHYHQHIQVCNFSSSNCSSSIENIKHFSHCILSEC